MTTLFIALFLAFVYCAPPIHVSPGLPVIRPEVGLILVYFIYGIITGRSANIMQSGRDGVTQAFAWMFMLAIVSIVCSSFRNPIAYNDLMILFMLAEYWLTFKFAQEFAENLTRRRILMLAVAACGCAAIIGILQYYDLGGVNEWLTPHYGSTSGEIVREYLEDATDVRAGGTHGDPRHFGFLLVTGLAACLVQIIFNRNTRSKIFSMVMAAICVVALMLTGSRTPFISLIIITGLGVWMAFKFKKYVILNHGMLLMLGCVMVVIFLKATPEIFKSRVLGSEKDEVTASYNPRQRDLIVPFTAALDDPTIFVVGLGPSKTTLRTSGHNDIGWYFHRFGIFGLLFYIYILKYGIKNAYRLTIKSHSDEERAIHAAALLVAVNWAIFVMAENIFKDGQMMGVNMFYLGLISKKELYLVSDRQHSQNGYPGQEGVRPGPSHWIRRPGVALTPRR